MENITNYFPISPKIGTAGQPRRDQFSSICAAGYETIINLAPSSSPNAIKDEKDIVESYRMEYISIPVDWENPTFDDLENLFEALETRRDKKVFVHCVLNMRVSVFLYLYRVIMLGESSPKVYKDIQKIWTPNDLWNKFINEALEKYGKTIDS